MYRHGQKCASPEDQERMSSDGTIDYEALTQDAMRGVVRRVLEGAAKHGLPGDHHFYISFDTLAPGVVLSKRLREKYTEEMTIVLQHRFWDLAVGDDRFEVKLTFDGIPERLVIPFRAIKVFFDPSVRYGLQFEAVDLTREDGSRNSAILDHRNGSGATSIAPGGLQQDHSAPGKPGRRENFALPRDELERPGQPPSIIAAQEAGAGQPGSDVGEQDGSPENENSGAEIVHLDAFRKK